MTMGRSTVLNPGEPLMPVCGRGHRSWIVGEKGSEG